MSKPLRHPSTLERGLGWGLTPTVTLLPLSFGEGLGERPLWRGAGGEVFPIDLWLMPVDLFIIPIHLQLLRVDYRLLLVNLCLFSMHYQLLRVDFCLLPVDLPLLLVHYQLLSVDYRLLPIDMLFFTQNMLIFPFSCSISSFHAHHPHPMLAFFPCS